MYRLVQLLRHSQNVTPRVLSEKVNFRDFLLGLGLPTLELFERRF